ncbi:MAG: FAD-dependent oxidoreductase [Clostridia bacterium]|nr:FAD-dependent oxidoreductase [Clostridia bacterium]
MSNDFDFCIAGGGVIGLAIAYRLSQQGSVLLLERHARFGSETSSRNSEVIHAGLYYQPGSLKEQLCLAGKTALYAFCEQHDVPHRRTRFRRGGQPARRVPRRGERQVHGRCGVCARTHPARQPRRQDRQRGGRGVYVGRRTAGRQRRCGRHGPHRAAAAHAHAPSGRAARHARVRAAPDARHRSRRVCAAARLRPRHPRELRRGRHPRTAGGRAGRAHRRAHTRIHHDPVPVRRCRSDQVCGRLPRARARRSRSGRAHH